MPRVAVDATAVAPAGKGHARTQRLLVNALAQLGRYELVAYVRSDDAAALLPSVETRVVRSPKAMLWEQIEIRRALRDADLMLTLGDRLPVGAERSFVVWLFESPTHRIAENRQNAAGWYQRGSDIVTSLMWRRSLSRAGRVVAGSESTARELHVPSTVIYPALDDGFTPGRGRPGNYVFHLGSADPRDNTAAVLDAFARLETNAELLVAGGLGTLDGPLRARARGRVSFLGRVSDDELVALYRGAAAYVDASLYEGFGYQVLEAMACGAPVVASDRTSIPEVVGDAGVLCDPESSEAISAALERVLGEPALADELRALGAARAQRFSWDRTALQFAAVLDELLA